MSLPDLGDISFSNDAVDADDDSMLADIEVGTASGTVSSFSGEPDASGTAFGARSERSGFASAEDSFGTGVFTAALGASFSSDLEFESSSDGNASMAATMAALVLGDDEDLTAEVMVLHSSLATSSGVLLPHVVPDRETVGDANLLDPLSDLSSDDLSGTWEKGIMAALKRAKASSSKSSSFPAGNRSARARSQDTNAQRRRVFSGGMSRGRRVMSIGPDHRTSRKRDRDGRPQSRSGTRAASPVATVARAAHHYRRSRRGRRGRRSESSSRHTSVGRNPDLQLS